MSRKKQKMKLTQDEFNQLHLEGKLELSASPCSGNLGVGWAGILYDHLLYEDDKYYYQNIIQQMVKANICHQMMILMTIQRKKKSLFLSKTTKKENIKNVYNSVK